MHAKMPGQKPAEAADYLCNICSSQFHFVRGTLECPVCGNTTKGDLIPVCVGYDPVEEVMYTADDWHGG